MEGKEIFTLAGELASPNSCYLDEFNISHLRVAAVRDGSETPNNVEMSKWKWTQSFQVCRTDCLRGNAFFSDRRLEYIEN